LLRFRDAFPAFLKNPLAAAALAVIAGGCLRLNAVRAPMTSAEFFRDEWEYYGLAAESSRTGLYRQFPGWPQTSSRLPLYPQFLSLVRGATPGLEAARTANALLDTAAIGGVYALTASFAAPWAAALAAWTYALDPIHSRHASALGLEPFLGAVMLAWMLALAGWTRRPESTARAAAAGILAAAALATRSSWGFFSVLVILWMRSAPRRPLAVFAVLSLAPGLFWGLRNLALFGMFMPFESSSAVAALWAASAGLRVFPSELDLPRLRLNPLFAEAHALPEGLRPAVLWKGFRENVTGAPLAYLVGALRRLPVLWAEKWPFAAAAGLLALGPLPRSAVPALLVAAYGAFHIAATVQPRYLRPLGGVLCALAAAGVWRLVAGRKAKPVGSEEPAARAAAVAAVLCGALLISCFWSRGSEALLGRPGAVPPDWFGEPDRYFAAKEANDRGVAAALAGRRAEAVGHFDRSLSIAPCFGEALISRGLVLQKEGRRTRDFDAAFDLLESGAKSCGSGAR
jgi:hypothetical protein